MSGAKQTISALKQYGFLIGVVSNGEGNVQRPKIAAAGLAEGLDLVVISGDIEAYKEFSTFAGSIWKEYGALEYVECVGDDMPY
ncbi:DUF1428 family protein, partial [Rhizobium johnstonii]|uniref:DUF1428 family protein n=1 Tax=Rhizobium johnstonii TaxID=3019933 RepID=UPI003F98642D